MPSKLRLTTLDPGRLRWGEGEQRVYVAPQVEALSGPERHRRLGVDRVPGSPVRLAQRSATASRGTGDRPDPAAVGAPEDEARAGTGDRVAALVQEPVVVAAELDEVVQARRATVRPVLDVVRVDGAVIRAAGEAAAAVAAAQRAAQRRRDAASLAPDAQRAAGALQERHDRRVACEPAGGLCRDRRAVCELRLAFAVAQASRVDVDDDLVAVAAA